MTPQGPALWSRHPAAVLRTCCTGPETPWMADRPYPLALEENDTAGEQNRALGPWQRAQCSRRCSPHQSRGLGTNSPAPISLPIQDEFPGLHWLPELEGSPLWHRPPFLWSALPWGYAHPEGSWALFNSQVTGHVWFRTSYYMKQVLGATEVGATPKGGPSPGPAKDTSVAAQVYGAFPGPRLYWPSTLPCEHCTVLLCLRAPLSMKRQVPN